MGKPIETRFTRQMMAIVFPGKTLGEAVAGTLETVAKAEAADLRRRMANPASSSSSPDKTAL